MFVAELLMQFKNFKKFANLLSSLYFLLKENNVKQAIFDEVWKVCDLPSLLLIKVAVTRWLSNNKATLCDLDWWGLLLQYLIKSINVNVNLSIKTTRWFSFHGCIIKNTNILVVQGWTRLGGFSTATLV